MSESRYEHLDRLRRSELGDWEGAADALDDWLMRVHGTTSGLHNLGLLLDLLADAGYVVLNPTEIHGWVADGVPPARWVLGADMSEEPDRAVDCHAEPLDPGTAAAMLEVIDDANRRMERVRRVFGEEPDR